MGWDLVFVTFWLIVFSLIGRKIDIGQGFIPEMARRLNTAFFVPEKKKVFDENASRIPYRVGKKKRRNDGHRVCADGDTLRVPDYCDS